ncbi:glycerophosphodiester phosphodiesterase [Halioglobus japonicus]|uniref:glycerophosphodiester phosphodiesterase n=1 Tax=Halioglobus japonicus TaxID=930805 RepID=A0AAP8MD64_9GAMM|nr:glycerophosphodiester phosphodiesterase [Halioglobus japonicus]AQA17542.1 glycerophosphodiester phosphodiesterase [Halioglobus japonicus]PLW85479.1 glycerophosphodiester phosphodiesterase [Halioglobus japonicus]GHD15845.1 glycerophosphodiester phosphodiesterase [Halioglobus japonicus]
MYRFICALLALLGISVASANPLVIAHRGASGYLPEHTLEAKAMAHAMGADFLEQDVVLTADGIPIVLHDIHLDPTTDVEERFPDRAREDGRYYALDFSLAEIRSLRAHERTVKRDTGEREAAYPGRFPLDTGHFTVPTLKEEIDLITGLNRSTGRHTGLYIELKAPQWHTQQGYDAAKAVLAVLEQTGYTDQSDRVILQCFDAATLRRLRHELNTPLPLIQLIADNSWGEDGDNDYDAMRTAAGIADIATYADGIGPWIPQLLTIDGASGAAFSTGLAELAHEAGLVVHPYTLRADDLPDGITVEQLHTALFELVKADGLFTDFPDLTRAFLDR